MINSFPKSKLLLGILTLGLLAGALSMVAVAQRQPAAKDRSTAHRNAAAYEIKVVPVGPSEAEWNALNRALPAQAAVAALLKGDSYRHLYTEPTYPDGKNGAEPAAATRYRAVFYNYSKQQTVVAEGVLGDLTSVAAHVQKDWQPSPNEEEFQSAVAILLADAKFGPALAAGEMATFRPMPPVREQNADGSAVKERILSVGLLPRPDNAAFKTEIVGVNLASQQIERYPGGAPPKARINQGAPNCGAPNAGQSTTARGTAGQFQLTVTDSGNTIWEMLIIRPSASSGTRASAIELQNVKYLGTTVLKRGHVPILNVKYVNDSCGPYRDWMYQEGMFAATGTDVATGIRDCGTNIATTELDTGTDTGNFRGVAIYREGNEVVLVTELEAGWYRYISEWRFASDGTIRPRFGFGAVVNSCTCLTHDHHVYFRFDLDVFQTLSRIYEIPVLARNIGDLPQYLISTEKKITRSATTQYFYRIRSGNGKASYLFHPGSHDGIADTYARGDMWFLRYRSTELDDGHNSTGSNTEADLDQFVNGEAVNDQDSVIWYHATVRHSPTLGSHMCVPTGTSTAHGINILSGDKVLGPDLIPENL